MGDAQKMGMNRTGIQMSPLHSRDMLEPVDLAEQLMPGETSEDPLALLGKPYIEGSSAVGTVPLPGSLKGVLQTAKEALATNHPTTLINKLGERLAFERAGVRLYEGLIRKCLAQQSGETQAQLPLDKLQSFRNDEERHFHLLVDALEEIGADPTAQTPDADVSGVAGMGLAKVVADPRTSLLHSLEAILIAELADHAAWHVLIELAEKSALDHRVAQFKEAEQQEERHLEQIKTWQKKLLQAGD